MKIIEIVGWVRPRGLKIVPTWTQSNPTQTSQKNLQPINLQNSTQDVKLGLVLGSDSLGWWVEYTHLIS